MSSSLTGGTNPRDAAEGPVFRALCISVGLVALIASCAVEQSEICQQYIACQTEYDEAAQTGPTDFADYEADGVCWANAENAALCDGNCTEAIEALREAAANAQLDVPACAGA